MSFTGTPSVIATMRGTPASAADAIMEAAAGGGTKTIDAFAPVALTAAITESNTGMPSTAEPPLPGVTPGKGGSAVEGIPVFDSVIAAVKATGANASMVFVPPPAAASMIASAADAGVPLIVAITEGVPVNDMIRAKDYLAKGK